MTFTLLAVAIALVSAWAGHRRGVQRESARWMEIMRIWHNQRLATPVRTEEIACPECGAGTDEDCAPGCPCAVVPTGGG